MPKRRGVIEDTQPALVPVLRKLLDRLAAGEDIRDQAAPKFTAQMPAERMKNIQKFLSTIWPCGVLTLAERCVSLWGQLRLVTIPKYLPRPGHYWVGLPKQRSNSLKTRDVHFAARKQTGVQAQPQIRAIEDPPTR
jgi:hypothetical protein